jgi:hypothetical protein
MYVYAVSASVLAFGLGWVGGFGLLGLIFAPVGALVAVLDSLFRILEWPWHYF